MSYFLQAVISSRIGQLFCAMEFLLRSQNGKSLQELIKHIMKNKTVETVLAAVAEIQSEVVSFRLHQKCAVAADSDFLSP